jgi:hypothetical protein
MAAGGSCDHATARTRSHRTRPCGSIPGPLGATPELPLSQEESAYVTAARAPNTLRGYRSDWAEFSSWYVNRALQRFTDPTSCQPHPEGAYGRR